MEPSILNSHIDAFNEKNIFLYFCLGFVSQLHNLIRDLEAGDSESTISDERGSLDGPTELAEIDQYLYFTLGLVSLSAKLLQDLESKNNPLLSSEILKAA